MENSVQSTFSIWIKILNLADIGSPMLPVL